MMLWPTSIFNLFSRQTLAFIIINIIVIFLNLTLKRFFLSNKVIHQNKKNILYVFIRFVGERFSLI